MTIQPIDRRRARVTLSAGDLEQLGVTRGELLSGSPKQAPILLKILELACLRAGLRPDGQIFIEAYPDEEGGCILYYSVLRSKPSRYRICGENHSPYLFRFDNADRLFDACRAVNAGMRHRVRRSSLYYRGEYLLSVYPMDIPQCHAVRRLAEFARCIGRGRILEGMVAEHCRELCRGDALGALNPQGPPPERLP